MSNKKDIIISINGQTHEFKQGDSDAILKLPWSERKQLIALLENIKQAEYIKSDSLHNTEVANSFRSDNNDASFPAANNPRSNNKSQADLNVRPSLDPAIKPSESDVEDLMNRLIVEQKHSHSSVPDKSVVYKWLMLLVAVLIGIGVIF